MVRLIIATITFSIVAYFIGEEDLPSVWPMLWATAFFVWLGFEQEQGTRNESTTNEPESNDEQSIADVRASGAQKCRPRRCDRKGENSRWR